MSRNNATSSLRAIGGAVVGGCVGGTLGVVAGGYNGAFFGFLIGTGLGAGFGSKSFNASIGASLGAFVISFIVWGTGVIVSEELIGESLEGFRENVVIFLGFIIGAAIGAFIGVKIDSKNQHRDLSKESSFTGQKRSNEIEEETRQSSSFSFPKTITDHQKNNSRTNGSIESKIECSSCGKRISINSNFCTYCGKEVRETDFKTDMK